MDLIKITEFTLGGIASLGIFFFGAGFWYSQFGKGKREEKDDIVSSADKLTQFWKDQAEGYKAMMAEKDRSNDDKIQKLTREVGELRGQLTEKTTSYEKLEKIFQNRNPEMESFMKTILAVAEQSQTFMANNTQFQSDQHNIMIEIRDFMGHINTHLESVDKDLKIEAKISKQ